MIFSILVIMAGLGIFIASFGMIGSLIQDMKKYKGIVFLSFQVGLILMLATLCVVDIFGLCYLLGLY